MVKNTKKIAVTRKQSSFFLTNANLLKGLGVILSLNLVVLIVWTAVAPPYRTEKIEISTNKDNNDSQSSEDKITYECDVSFPSSVFVITLIVLQALLLVFNCVVSFLLRNLPSTFNESKHIAFTVYNSAVMMIVAIVLVIVFNDDKTAVLVIIALVSHHFVLMSSPVSTFSHITLLFLWFHSRPFCLAVWWSFSFCLLPSSTCRS